jgi:hypothetical protein
MSNLSKTNSVARMAINPGIPIPSAMPRVSLERPFDGADDGADDGEDEGVGTWNDGPDSDPMEENNKADEGLTRNLKAKIFPCYAC